MRSPRKETSSSRWPSSHWTVYRTTGSEAGKPDACEPNQLLASAESTVVGGRFAQNNRSRRRTVTPVCILATSGSRHDRVPGPWATVTESDDRSAAEADIPAAAWPGWSASSRIQVGSCLVAVLGRTIDGCWY